MDLSRYSYSSSSGDILVNGSIQYSKHSKGYLGVGAFLAHRLAWKLHYGAWPENQIDHINGDKKDNRILNLRCVSNVENHKNMPLQKNNKAGIPGVHWIPRLKKWRVQIKHLGIVRYFGHHKSFLDACCARKSAEILFGFHSNHGRRC